MLQGDRDDWNAQDIENGRRCVKFIHDELGNAASFHGNGLENIGKFHFEILPSPGIDIDGDGRLLNVIITSELINAMDMVGMRMGVKDGINPRNSLAQGLLSQVRRGVDQEAFWSVAPLGLNPNGGTKPFVFRIFRAADFAIAVDQRNAGGSSASEDRKNHRRFYLTRFATLG